MRIPVCQEILFWTFVESLKFDLGYIFIVTITIVKGVRYFVFGIECVSETLMYMGVSS